MLMTDRDVQTEPNPAPVYLPADHPCDGCGEDRPLSEWGECAECEARYHEDPQE